MVRVQVQKGKKGAPSVKRGELPPPAEQERRWFAARVSQADTGLKGPPSVRWPSVFSPPDDWPCSRELHGLPELDPLLTTSLSGYPVSFGTMTNIWPR